MGIPHLVAAARVGGPADACGSPRPPAKAGRESSHQLPGKSSGPGDPQRSLIAPGRERGKVGSPGVAAAGDTARSRRSPRAQTGTRSPRRAAAPGRRGPCSAYSRRLQCELQAKFSAGSRAARGIQVAAAQPQAQAQAAQGQGQGGRSRFPGRCSCLPSWFSSSPLRGRSSRLPGSCSRLLCSAGPEARRQLSPPSLVLPGLSRYAMPGPPCPLPGPDAGLRLSHLGVPDVQDAPGSDRGSPLT